MRISRQLRIISTVTISALVVMALFLIWEFTEFNNAKNDYLLGEEIKVKFFERASFRNQYFLYREDRARTQWDEKKEITDKLLHQAEAQFHGEENRQNLMQLLSNIEGSALIFHRIVNATEVLKTPGGNRLVYEELYKRLASQLLLKDELIRDTMTAMQNRNAGLVERAYKRLSIIAGLFAASLALATILISMHLGKLIRKRLKPLHDGAKIVADGDLGYRINLGGADEFSDLSQSVDAMTAKLQTFTRRLEADLIELKRSDEALQASEERWKFALEGSGDGVWDWNPRTDEALFSRQWKAMIGYCENEFPDTGAAWVEHLHPDDHDRVLSAVQEYFDGKRPFYAVEFRMRCKDGSWKWIMARGKVVTRDVDGRPLRMIGTHTDISERKFAEKNLRITSSVFDNSHRPIVITDANGVIQEANLAFMQITTHQFNDMASNNVDIHRSVERISGLSDFIGITISEAMPGKLECFPELFEAYGKVASSGKLERFETYVSELGIWFSVSVYCPEQGRFVVTFDNVTERIKTEQELLVMNSHLAHEVAKRTADLSALAAHIQDIAETERVHIARELHDELGNTLTGLNMEVGRLQNKISAPELLQDLSLITNLLANANQTTRAVINQLYPTVLDTFGFVAAVEWLVKEFMTHSGIAVELIISEEQIDMEQEFALAAYRIIQECLTNIAKHAKASKVFIEAETGNGFLDLSIEDNGKGLSSVTNTDGHGIFGMIERARYLGGSMEIGSGHDKGTTARLRLPLTAAKPENKKRVLVVDDHAIVRNALRQLLDSQTDDFSVEGEAADGITAIEMAIEGAWDIMLLDITLPKKNGLKVLEEIRSAKPNLPVIMLSSHAEDDYGEIARNKGAACYIEKGETSKLVEAMRRATLSGNQFELVH